METISPAPDLEAHLGYWLRHVSHHVSGAFARALHQRRTAVAEWVVLCELARRAGLTPTELAARLDLTRGAVSKIVAKVQSKGWVAQAAKPGDGRVQLLSLTRRGRRMLPVLAEIADRNDRHFFDGLAAREQATLLRLLRKLATLHQMRGVPID